MSRMRRRYRRHRSRASRASKLLLPPVIPRCPPSLDDRPVIIAAIAGFVKELTPAGRIVMRLGGQDPAEKHLLLLWGAIGIDLDVGPAGRHALDLVHRGDAFLAIEVVNDIDRDRCGEAVVRERQLDAIADMQTADHLGFAMHQRIFGDVEAESFQARAHLAQILDEEALGTAYIEHPIAGLQPEMLDDVLSDWNPAAVIAVAAVAGVARPVEILAAIFAGDADVLFALRAGPFLDIAFGARIAAQ